MSWGSSVSAMNRLGAGWLGFDSRQGQGTFFFATASRLDLGTTKPRHQ